MDKNQLIQKAYTISQKFEDDGVFPNNPQYPLLVYKGALFLHPDDDVSVVKQVFEHNNWTNVWQNGIYDYHHYHSNTHEAMAIFCGKADVQFGGPHGICLELLRGDVLIIPAGVAHKCIESSHEFCCIGAYPNGIGYDINYGKEGERPAADDRIKNVPLPVKDPVYGDNGPLKEKWVQNVD